MHGPYDLAIREGAVALESDGSDLDLGTLVNGENQLDRVRGGDFFVGRLDHRELMTMLRLEVLDHHFGFLDFRRVKLTFHRKAHLAIFEAIEDV